MPATTNAVHEAILEIANEPVSLGRIEVEALNANPEMIKDKLNEKIQALLDRYGYSFQISNFTWGGGTGVTANIELVARPAAPSPTE